MKIWSHRDRADREQGGDDGASVVLVAEGVTAEFVQNGVISPAVRAVDVRLHAGEKLGLVGESGCGKSTLALALAGLLPLPGRVTSGRVVVRGHDMLRSSERRLRHVWGKEIGFVFQDPTTALNPVVKVGKQVVESLAQHNPGATRRELRSRALELMAEVGIHNPSARADDYPHQFSGGMLQRVMIAIALANTPAVLIADEPTTALDVTTQAQVLEVIHRMASQRGTAVILITHSLGVVSEFCDTVQVMYAGRVVESGPAESVLVAPSHPYTAALLDSIVYPGRDRADSLPAIPGTPPKLGDRLPGCAFEPRCGTGAGHAICQSADPGLSMASGRTNVSTACHFPIVTGRHGTEG